MLDLRSVHVRARHRKATIGVERGLDEAARIAGEEGFAAAAPVLDRLDVLIGWTAGRLDAAVLDGRTPDEGVFGWFLLEGERVLLATPAETLREAARFVGRLGSEPAACPLLGGDPQSARDAGLLLRAEETRSAPVVYGPTSALEDVVQSLVWKGASPLAEVRLDSPRPLLTAAGDPVEAIALAGALAAR